MTAAPTLAEDVALLKQMVDYVPPPGYGGMRIGHAPTWAYLGLSNEERAAVRRMLSAAEEMRGTLEFIASRRCESMQDAPAHLAVACSSAGETLEKLYGSRPPPVFGNPERRTP